MLRKLLAVKTHCLQGSKCYHSVVNASMRKVLYTQEVAKPFSWQLLTVTQLMELVSEQPQGC